MAKRRQPVDIGLVGLGFMGLTHLRAARQLRAGRLVALVTSDPRKARGDFSRVRGNFGPGGSREDLEGITVYPTVDDLLADERVGLVDVCLPSYLHARTAVRALRAGKHVLVEKPVALRTADARRILRASEEAGKLVMVAQVLKFFPEFDALAKAVRQETYGRLLALHAHRIIAPPEWSDDNWLADPKLSGGMVVDLHIHDTDFDTYLFGKPQAVSSHGLVEDDTVRAIRTVYDYGAEGPLVSAEAGWINAPSLPFRQGYTAWFEKGTVEFDSSHCPKPQVHGARRTTNLRLPRRDAFQAELQAAVDSVHEGEVSPLLSAEQATRSLEVCLAEARSARARGKRVKL